MGILVSLDAARATADADSVVVSNRAVNAEYRHLVAAVAGPATSAAPGQFFHLECPAIGADKPFFRRPMSTYRVDPAAGTVDFLYKVAGAGTRGLASLRRGDRLRMLGPLGRGFALRPEWRAIVVLGRGAGLATLAPLAETAQEAGIAVTALLSARGPGQVLSADRFRAAGATVEILTDADGSAAPEAVECRLRALAAAGRADAFFTCGSNRLIRLMQRLGAEFGIPGQVAIEQQMACGLGMCFCCVRDVVVDGRTEPRRVCWDGPVFDLQAVLPC